jgi:hypothetical protein
VLLDARLEGPLEVLQTDVHVPAHDLLPQTVPLALLVGEGEPDLEVTELLVQPDLLNQGLDHLIQQVWRLASWFRLAGEVEAWRGEGSSSNRLLHLDVVERSFDVPLVPDATLSVNCHVA